MTIPQKIQRGLLVAIAFVWTAAIHPAPGFALEVGDAAPDFRLKSTSGKPVSLGDYRGKKNVVIQFYVLDFTPG
jgi:hypothetical protein